MREPEKMLEYKEAARTGTASTDRREDAMKEKVLVFEAMRCTGCRICEQWCSVHHFGAAGPSLSRITIIRDHVNQIDNGIICHQCVDAPCIASCKFGALSKDGTTGAILVDIEKCTGCRRCIKACPHGAVRMHPEEKYVLICDLCGGDPKCVRHCPEKAVQYLERGKSERPYRSALVGRLARRGECDEQ